MTSNNIDEKFIRMTTAPVEKLICVLAVPCIAIMLISSFYNAADTYFVGEIGTGAIAAVGVSFSIMTLIQAVGYMFGQGSGNYISRQMGAQNWEAASLMAVTGFVSSFAVGAAIAACGMLFLQPLARLLGATETILSSTCDYIFYILIGAPWMTSSLTLNNILRYQGSAFYGMWGMITGAVLNVALDPLFIFTFGMGVSGAGLATMISQVVSCCLLLVGCSRKGNISINIKKFKPTAALYVEIIHGGLPALLRQGLSSVSTICLNHIAGIYGVAVIAAFSVVQRISFFAASAMFGFGQGFQPVCGFNYGAKRYDRVRRAFWFCVNVSSWFLLSLSVLGYIFAPRIIEIFQATDPDVIRVGAAALRFQCITFTSVGWLTLNNMMSQTIGKPFEASILAMTRQGLCLMPVLFILPPFLGVFGIQLAQPISDVCALIISVPLSARLLREVADRT